MKTENRKTASLVAVAVLRESRKPQNRNASVTAVTAAGGVLCTPRVAVRPLTSREGRRRLAVAAAPSPRSARYAISEQKGSVS